MVDVFSLNPGDKVRIVSCWNSPHNENKAGLMDAYLGTTMTVKSVHEENGLVHAHMIEDQCDAHRNGQGWRWYGNMIESVNDVNVCDKSDLWDDLMNLIGVNVPK